MKYDNLLDIEATRVIPCKFLSMQGQFTTLEGEVLVDEAEWVSLISPSEIVVPFEKPTRDMAKHLKPLFVMTHINDMPKARVFVDPKVVLNVIPLLTLRKLRKSQRIY